MQSSSTNEYRVTIRDKSGNITRRQIVAVSTDHAKKRAIAFIPQGSTIQSIKQKVTYQYRVLQGNNTIEGSQSAYSREEVVLALQRMGFKIK